MIFFTIAQLANLSYIVIHFFVEVPAEATLFFAKKLFGITDLGGNILEGYSGGALLIDERPCRVDSATRRIAELLTTTKVRLLSKGIYWR